MAKLLRLPQVLDAVQMSKATLYRMVKSGTFPAPLRPSMSRMIAWKYVDIEEWIDSRTRN